MTEITLPELVSRPNVYFIDDSATMREVVKIAFRRENFNVVTCSDMASAVAQFDQTIPNAVISDVIMPDKDGYQLCEYIKQHPQFGGTPVFLMSGVVNKEVAERAHQVKADELIRKPFHPQDLVARVKKLLNREEPAPAPVPSEAGAPNPLSWLFESTGGPAFPTPPPPPAFAPPRMPQPARTLPAAPASNGAELQKLQIEVKRLEALVKKLQNELASEREYCATLESQLQTLSTAK
jgi:DNA-binding response OmpR family regulator